MVGDEFTKSTLTNSTTKSTIKIGGNELNIDVLKFQIKTMFSSPNPWALYNNIKKFKEEISNFINSLTKEIVKLFDLEESKVSIVKLYQKAQYHKIFIRGMEEYIYESKYFDILFYFYTIISFEKEYQYLGKVLLKIYNGSNDDEINKFLKHYKSNIDIAQARRLYKQLEISNINIEKRYLNENSIDHFLEKIYLNLDIEKRKIFLNEFKLKKISADFTEIFKVFGRVTSFYIKEEELNSASKSRIVNYINSNALKNTKLAIDQYINQYPEIKNDFYDNIMDIVNQENVQKYDLMSYVKSQIINKYFPDLKHLFYWEIVRKFIPDRLVWNNISGNLDYDDEGLLKMEFYQKCSYFKNLIMELQNNIWWTFLKPMIYRLILEHLKVDRKSFNKLQYIMCFIIAKDYSEYKQIYRFFSDVKNIYGFYDINFTNLRKVINRFKVSLSLIIIFALSIILLYFTAPVILFICVLLLGFLYFFDFLTDDIIHGIEWNTGIKTFLIIATVFFGFTWFINFGKSLEQSEQIIKKINYASSITVSDLVEQSQSGNLTKYITDILNGYKNVNIFGNEKTDN